MPRRRGFRCGKHGGIFKLLDATAAHADQVMVVAVIVARQLKASPALGKFQLLQQTHPAQQPQRAIDRRQRHLLPLEPQALMGFLRTEVAPLSQALEQLQHPLPLGSEPLASVVEAAAQALIRPLAGFRGSRGIRWAVAHALGPSWEKGGGGPLAAGPPAVRAAILSSRPTRPAASRSATVTTSR